MNSFLHISYLGNDIFHLRFNVLYLGDWGKGFIDQAISRDKSWPQRA